MSRRFRPPTEYQTHKSYKSSIRPAEWPQLIQNDHSYMYIYRRVSILHIIPIRAKLIDFNWTNLIQWAPHSVQLYVYSPWFRWFRWFTSNYAEKLLQNFGKGKFYTHNNFFFFYNLQNNREKKYIIFITFRIIYM